MKPCPQAHAVAITTNTSGSIGLCPPRSRRLVFDMLKASADQLSVREKSFAGAQT